MLALTLSNICFPLLVLFYMSTCQRQELVTWEGWGYESLYEWGQYMRLAAPGLVLLFLDWFTIEIINFVAGWLGEKELAANSVMSQTTFMLSLVSYWVIQSLVLVVALDQPLTSNLLIINSEKCLNKIFFNTLLERIHTVAVAVCMLEFSVISIKKFKANTAVCGRLTLSFSFN